MGLPHEDHSRLLELLERGLSTRRIANELGVSLGCVRGRMARSGLKTKFHMHTRSWTDDELRSAVVTSTSISQVIGILGLSTTGAGNWATVNQHVKRLGLDVSHMEGRAWVGKTRPHPSKKPLSEILVRDSTFRSAHLAKRLLTEGVMERVCSRCLRTEWQGTNIPLELDHINGDPRDNRLENLRFLCPNCHALTPTWRGRNQRRRLLGETGITRA